MINTTVVLIFSSFLSSPARAALVVSYSLSVRIACAAFREFDSHCCPHIMAEKRIARNDMGVNRKLRPGVLSV